MKKTLAVVPALMLIGALSTHAYSAVEKPQSPVLKMSKEKLISLAQSAAPEFISRDATVLIPGPDGNLTEARKGTNDFICIPDISAQETPDPFCGDKAAFQWLTDAMSNAERPTNERAGVGYMAKGGWHWEKDGRVVMPDEAGAKRVKEPPHWMVFWPIESGETMLPSTPGKFGTFIMHEGTPYAHLMIYQDPGTLMAPKQ